MKIGITYRLFLAILAAAGLSVISMLLIMHWNIERGFLRYINELDQTRQVRVLARLAESYSAEGNWDSLRRESQHWHDLMTVTPRPDDLNSPPPPPVMHGPRQHRDVMSGMGPPSGRRFDAGTSRDSGRSARACRHRPCS